MGSMEINQVDIECMINSTPSADLASDLQEDIDRITFRQIAHIQMQYAKACAELDEDWRHETQYMRPWLGGRDIGIALAKKRFASARKKRLRSKRAEMHKVYRQRTLLITAAGKYLRSTQEQ